MRPLLAFLRRALGLEEKETPQKLPPAPASGAEGAPEETHARLPGAVPPETDTPGGMPESAWGGAPGGALPRGSAEEQRPGFGQGTPPAEDRRWSRAPSGEMIRLAGPPEDGARRLSELLRLQRRMGSTVGTFGEEVL